MTTRDGGRAARISASAPQERDESARLGLLFPPVAERFERLKEAILICKQLWAATRAR